VIKRLAMMTLLASAGTASAQPFNITATPTVLAGCRYLVENVPNGDMMQMGACAGAVSSALDISRQLRRSCPPPDVDVLAAARRIIAFVDENPARKADQFGPLALIALSDRWPC
jgi:Ssp1 endopeptidase immunity protein Rap1a